MTTEDDQRWAGALLSRAVGTEPELGFRPEDVLTRAHRSANRRRAVVAGAATVAALGGVGLLVGQLAVPRAGVQSGAAPTLTATPTETTLYDVEGPLVVDDHSRALTQVLAGAHLIPPGVTASTDKSDGGRPLVFYKLITGQYVNSYLAQATLTDAHGAGHLVVHVLDRQTGITCAGADPATCHTQTLPDGSRITVQRYTPSGPGKPVIQWIAELVHPDGTAVDVLCGNWSMSGDPNTAGIDHATGAEPPLSEDTVTRIAELPGLVP